VLDFGRTTFGACLQRAQPKRVLELAIAPRKHPQTIQQETLGEFELVKKKIARIAADAYCHGSDDHCHGRHSSTAGLEDYMLETAMLKVFTTERLWECINDVFQIYGRIGVLHPICHWKECCATRGLTKSAKGGQ